MWLWIVLFLIAVYIYNKIGCGWCYARTVMTGKVIIVTGANAGIGYETALNLAKRGGKVILACRDDAKGKKAAEEIQTKSRNKSVVYKHLDLTSLKSVRKFVEDLKRDEVKVDILVNNAGCAGFGDKKTEDGIVMEMQANHFGPFLLTILLVPLLKNADGGRIINVSSQAHWSGKINFEKLNKEQRHQRYKNAFSVYSNSKLCNVLFTNELARRLAHTNVTVNSLHPGHINTSIYRPFGYIIQSTMSFILSTFFKSPLEGAQTTIFLAVSDDVAEVTGKYFVDCKEGWTSPAAKDKDLAIKLWNYSADLVNLKPEENI